MIGTPPPPPTPPSTPQNPCVPLPLSHVLFRVQKSSRISRSVSTKAGTPLLRWRAAAQTERDQGRTRAGRSAPQLTSPERSRARAREGEGNGKASDTASSRKRCLWREKPPSNGGKTVCRDTGESRLFFLLISVGFSSVRLWAPIESFSVRG